MDIPMKFHRTGLGLDSDKNSSEPAISCQFGWQIFQWEFGRIPRSPIGKLGFLSESDRNRWGSVKTSHWVPDGASSSSNVTSFCFLFGLSDSFSFFHFTLCLLGL